MSKDNVRTLPGVVLESEAPSPEIIQRCQEYLDRAKRGDLIAIAITAVGKKGHVYTGWDCPGLGTHSLLAGTVYLQKMIIDESSPPEDIPEGA